MQRNREGEVTLFYGLTESYIWGFSNLSLENYVNLLFLVTATVFQKQNWNIQHCVVWSITCLVAHTKLWHTCCYIVEI